MFFDPWYYFPTHILVNVTGFWDDKQALWSWTRPAPFLSRHISKKLAQEKKKWYSKTLTPLHQFKALDKTFSN